MARQQGGGPVTRQVVHLVDGRMTAELRQLLCGSGIAIRGRCGVVRPVLSPVEPTLSETVVLCRNCERIRRGDDA